MIGFSFSYRTPVSRIKNTKVRCQEIPDAEITAAYARVKRLYKVDHTIAERTYSTVKKVAMIVQLKTTNTEIRQDFIRICNEIAKENR